MPFWHSWIFLRAINLQIYAIENTVDPHSRKFKHDTEVLSEHQQSMWHLSGELFASRTRLSAYIDRLAKIDTQLHTEVKEEENFEENFPNKE